MTTTVKPSREWTVNVGGEACELCHVQATPTRPVVELGLLGRVCPTCLFEAAGACEFVTRVETRS